MEPWGWCLVAVLFCGIAAVVCRRAVRGADESGRYTGLRPDRTPSYVKSLIRPVPPPAWIAASREEYRKRHGQKLNGTSTSPAWATHACSADIAVLDEVGGVLRGYCCGVCGSIVVGEDEDEEEETHG